MSVLIIGVGTVGGNLSRELAALQPQLYDKYKGFDTRQGGAHYDAAFVCVDTPGTDCDITEVRAAIMEHDADVFVIKSTVLPGTTERLKRESGKAVIFSPEYYGGTQHCNNFSFPFTILGGEKEACVKVVQILQSVYDGRHMKVSFCQQFFDIAEKAGVCYEELRELFVLDPRVEPSHTFVYRDKPYWDSHCLNKDVPAIAGAYDAPLLNDIIAFNEARTKQGGT